MPVYDPENPFVVAKDTVTGSHHVIAKSAVLAADEGRYEITDASPFDHNGDLKPSKPNVRKGAAKRANPSAASEPTPKE